MIMLDMLETKTQVLGAYGPSLATKTSPQTRRVWIMGTFTFPPWFSSTCWYNYTSFPRSFFYCPPFDKLVMLCPSAPALIHSLTLTFMVNRQFYFTLLISYLAVLPFSHGLQVDIEPTVTAGASSLVTWTRDSTSDPSAFGLVSSSLNSDTGKLGDLVAVLAGEAKRGTAQVVFPSAGQFLLLAVQETKTVGSQPTLARLIPNGKQVSSVGNVAPINKNPPQITTRTSTSKTTVSSSKATVSPSRTTRSVIQTTKIVILPVSTEPSSSEISQTSKPDSTSTRDRGTGTTTTITPQDTRMSLPSVTPSPTISDTNKTASPTPQPTDSDVSRTRSNTFSSSSPESTIVSSPPMIPLPSPTGPQESKRSCKEDSTCFRGHGATIVGTITGVFLVAVVLLEYLRYQRFKARRRLKKFGERFFGEKLSPVRDPVSA
ncbi:hypothetical protein E1B28_013021 [Marasmius oreades]|uniref:Uncharacterized protein n=1 Tax=Marasmius oreades TaxID=181124 RepID=A0A9P7RP20_9AGAR|nr:uncharacterized protein E1B28_013021 [Marasmius oreades]KAG7087042.1 hypothetical protein E1B28_013021 [Marasmius oreades]